MKSGEKITQLVKELLIFSLLGLVIFQNMRLDVTSDVAAEFHYRFYYILSEKFDSQHLFEHIFRVEDFDNYVLNYMVPSLYLGEDVVSALEDSKLLINLIDTRKEKLVIDNIKVLRQLWEENGWDASDLENPEPQPEQPLPPEEEPGDEESDESKESKERVLESEEEHEAEHRIPEIMINRGSPLLYKDLIQVEAEYIRKLQTRHAEEEGGEAPTPPEEPGTLNQKPTLMNNLITPIEVSLESYKMTRVVPEVSSRERLYRAKDILSREGIPEDDEYFVDYTRTEDGASLFVPTFHFNAEKNYFQKFISRPNQSRTV